jgi:hypothetical protein
MASERNPAASAEDDDVVERAPSHPVTTVLLIVSTVALLFAIGLTGSELGRYVNKATASQLDNYKKTAVRYFEDEFPETDENLGGGETERSRRRVPAEKKEAEEAAPPADEPG